MERISRPQSIVRPLEGKFVADIVQIHQSVFGYTLNGQLGNRHLALMYQNMSSYSECYVGVAFIDDQPVGMVSGTFNVEKTKSALLRSFTAENWANIIIHMIKCPSLIYEWWKSNFISRTVYSDGKSIDAVLATIAVDSRFQGSGIGKQLIVALEKFFKDRNIQNYRLDTLINNYTAREFYRKLGFQEIEIRVDSVILLKKIGIIK